jgi:hypothetical protein
MMLNTDRSFGKPDWSSNRKFAYLEKRKGGLGFRTWFLALAITSLFYVLPLGRFAFAGVDTDFRIYDFILFGLFIILGQSNWRMIQQLMADHKSIYYWAGMLILLIWPSLIITTVTSGEIWMFTGAIRAWRFSAFLMLPVVIAVIADTPHKQRFLTNIFFLNCIVQAGLAFGQGIGQVPNFWPSYWLPRFGVVTVGTLSPHHLQIAVVMMLTLPLTFTFFRNTRNVVWKIILALILGMALSVIIFSGTRSVWAAIPFIVLAYFFAHRVRNALPSIILITLIMGVLGWWNWDKIQNPLEEKIDDRFTNVIENRGAEGLISERENVYIGDLLLRFSRRPIFLLIGTGYQNISYVAWSTGAHNNYLHAWLELGVIGFFVYIRFLKSILDQLWLAAQSRLSRFEVGLPLDGWVAFVGVLVTMLANETLWGQYSMFTLSGQIMTLVGLGVCSLHWTKESIPSEK